MTTMVIAKSIGRLHSSTSKCLPLLGGHVSYNFQPHFVVKRTLISSSACLGRLFTQKHEWISVKDKIGTVGISDHAQAALGDVVFIQLPEIGTELAQEGECGVVESVKAASDIYSPVSGRVVEANTGLVEEPSLINKSCYDKGWLFKLEVKNEDELKKLMDETAYDTYLKTLEHD